MGDHLADKRRAADRLPRTSGKATSPQRSPSLATLTGSIAGNKFSGTEADVASGSTHRLDASADFEGSFKGGFYGAKGAEAGGVFDFASEDNEGGAFRGAFGGKQD